MTSYPQSTGGRSGFSDELQLRRYFEMGSRRRWWIILPATAIATIALVVALRLPNIYRSETVILVDPQKVPDNYVTPTVSSTIADRLPTLQQQVMSPTRLKRLIDMLGLYRDIRGKISDQELITRMQRATTIELVTRGAQQLSAFRIAFHGRNPVEVADVANRLAAMFIEENLKAREQQSYGTAEFLENELRETQRQLEEKEAELQRIKSANILDLPESKQYHLETLTNLRNQLRASQDRVNRAQQEKVYLQSLLISTAPTVDLDAAGTGTPGSSVRSEIQTLQTRLSELQRRYGPNHPDVRKVRSQIAQLESKLPPEDQSGPQEVPVEPLRRVARNPVIEAQLQKLDQEIEEQTKLQAQLEPQINFHISKLERVPVFEQRILNLMRDYETIRAHYTQLLDKKLSAEMANALESRQKGERFVVLDPAQVPEEPFGPNRPLIALAGLFGGIMGGIGLALIAEMGDDSVRDETDAVKILGAPALAGVPFILTHRERSWQRLRAAGSLAGTMIGSWVVGLLIAHFGQRFF